MKYAMEDKQNDRPSSRMLATFVTNSIFNLAWMYLLGNSWRIRNRNIAAANPWRNRDQGWICGDKNFWGWNQ